MGDVSWRPILKDRSAAYTETCLGLCCGSCRPDATRLSISFVGRPRRFQQSPLIPQKAPDISMLLLGDFSRHQRGLRYRRAGETDRNHAGTGIRRGALSPRPFREKAFHIGSNDVGAVGLGHGPDYLGQVDRQRSGWQMLPKRSTERDCTSRRVGLLPLISNVSPESEKLQVVRSIQGIRRLQISETHVAKQRPFQRSSGAWPGRARMNAMLGGRGRDDGQCEWRSATGGFGDNHHIWKNPYARLPGTPGRDRMQGV